MRKIHGYVCAAGQTLKGYKYLYGENIEIFGWEGFRPFTSLRKAIRAQNEILTIEQFRTARIMHISLCINETQDELTLFEKERKLVVIAMFDDTLEGWCEIVGPRMDGFYGCINQVSEFQNNGYVQFITTHDTDRLDKKRLTCSAFKHALYVLSEINRQGKMPARLATLRFEWRGKKKIKK